MTGKKKNLAACVPALHYTLHYISQCFYAYLQKHLLDYKILSLNFHHKFRALVEINPYVVSEQSKFKFHWHTFNYRCKKVVSLGRQKRH